MNFNKFYLAFVFIIPFISACTVSKDPLRTPIRNLQRGITSEDTSYAYSLPYATNTKHRVVQGYFSRLSHKNRAALDFNMKRGTGIFASRAGIVIRVKEDGYKGGLSKKYRREGNFIVIQHEDSSRAGYWHLQHNGALVKVGDSVVEGQQIGLSGKTGYALFPHLHFLVWRYDRAGQWLPAATRFKTSKGIIYLRPFRRYRTI